MPTYEYLCDKCKKSFDLLQSIKADPIKKCPECGGKVHRLIGGGSGIIFKGSGFYETDYKKKKNHSHSDSCKHCPANKDKKCSKE
jgi:putative FmdB family regulatory protein